MSETADSAAEARRIEAGRQLFARPWQFRIAAVALDGLPEAGGIEVAFAGRSNVGKSSLLNALTGQTSLARTSNTPGRTRALNYFADTGEIVIVDMPGYGYARASKSDSAAWNALVFAYLRGRANLRRVYLLIDSRHGLKANDLDVLDLLDRAAVSYQIVLTKADKLKPDQLEAVMRGVATAVAKRPAAYPEVLTTSASSGAGMAELRAAIAALLETPTADPAVN
jgi:GTP-binding protein